MSKRVLIVEDSRTEALKARLILEREGFQVTLASNGKEGLAKAAEEKPDLILLDTLMPVMGGYEACGKIKLDPKTRDIPVVMMATQDELAEMPSGSSVEWFLTKPYDPDRLRAKVNDMTNGHHVEAPAGDLGPIKAEVDRLTKALQTAQKSRSDVLANMSHELRTPLHEIIGMTDLLSGTGLTAEQQGYLDTTKTSSNALLSLIGDVIEFSELEAGQLGLEEKPFDLSEPIESTVEIMATRAAEKGLNFSTTISSQAPRVLIGDANRLRQILANLVANAIKFTDRGDVSIRVDADSVRGGEVELHVRVSDTGIGIPADRRELILEPFQQADASTTRRYGGMGMGLALAKQLVTLMGGRIWVESQIGQGSTFHFTVRLKRSAQTVQTAAPVVPAANNWPRPLNILVAEDSPTNQLIAKSSLKKAGHTVALAFNGLEAVQAFATSRAGPCNQPFELVLMDVSMPEMDGLEATRAIREKEKTLGGHILIVAMTAFATQEYHEKCLESGMDAYVTKPVRIDELNKALEPLMAREPEAPTLREEPPEPSPVALAEALEVVGGDVDILREAARLSLEEVPEQLEALKAALSAQDAKAVEAKAHRLKGVMGNLGGIQARDMGQRLETIGEQCNLTGGLDVLRVFEKEIGRVVAFYSDPAWEQRAREYQEAHDG